MSESGLDIFQRWLTLNSRFNRSDVDLAHLHHGVNARLAAARSGSFITKLACYSVLIGHDRLAFVQAIGREQNGPFR
ncbi:hypothetical protein ACYZT2_12715 [Pseudomonas sp. MDT1-85]